MKSRRLSFRAPLLMCAMLCLVVALRGTAARAQGQDRAPEYFPADIEYGAMPFGYCALRPLFREQLYDFHSGCNGLFVQSSSQKS